MQRNSLQGCSDLSWLKVTDDKASKIAFGRRLVEEKPLVYAPSRIAEIKNEISSLMTLRIRMDFSEEDVFYISIYDFWVYGNVTSEEFYFGFLYKTHREKMEYVTYCTRLFWTNRLNDRSNAYILHDKYETYKRFGKYYLREIIRVGGKEDYDEFLKFVSRHDFFVVKPASASLGIGVRKISLRDYSSPACLFAELLENAKEFVKDNYARDTSFLLEEVIDQHPDLARIHPYSINGIRISTLRNGREVKLLYPWFKIGANKSFVTSAAFGTYDAGIDAQSGIVNTDGYKENGQSDFKHPLTGIVFNGYKIPNWKEAVALARDLALSMPDCINYVGWDLVLTPKGWCIMEGNFAGDYMWQMFTKRGFRKELEELTGICLEKGFWWQHGK